MYIIVITTLYSGPEYFKKYRSKTREIKSLIILKFRKNLEIIKVYIYFRVFFTNNIRFRNDIGLQRNCHRPHGKPEQILDYPCLYYVLELQPFFEGNLVLLKNKKINMTPIFP